jgi:hypothetical protein
MALPKVTSNYIQERQGVLRVATLLNNAGLIFRETPNADVGIDGHIELVNVDGEATGASVAVQIKSGPSYLKKSGNAWAFYPEEKHALYWEMYPLPVILILHDPNSDLVYWDDVRLTLRSDQTKKSPLLIPREKVLIAEQATNLFASCGTGRNGLLLPEDVLRSLALSRNRNACFPLTYLDLFLEGLTDIGRKLFFSAGMCWNLAELFLPNNSPTDVGMGSVEHDFLEDYLRFLVEQSLAHIDYSDIIIDIVHRQMHPTILVPLTARGRTVRDLCRKIAEVLPPSAITEATIGLAYNPMNATRSLANHEVSKQIESHFLAKKKS